MVKLIDVNKPTREKSYIRLNHMVNRPEDGSIPVYHDKKAVHDYFIQEVNANYRHFDQGLEEKLEYLTKHDYIEEEFLNKYSTEFIKEVFKEIYGYKIRFKSLMGAFKAYEQYMLKERDGSMWLERYEDRIAFNALYLADGDEDLAMELAKSIGMREYQPATPTFLNAGKKNRGELVSCYLIQPGDTMNDIGRSVNSALQLSRIGGGVGINLSNLREAGAPIKGNPGLASGVVPVMKLFEDSFSYSNQLGQRQGAGATYLSVFHPDIIQFLSTKKENADEKIRVKTLSLGLTVPDKFYELVAENKPMYLFSPHDVEREYGVPFSYIDITAMYDELVANERISKKKVSAREVEEEISKLQQESGYPYIVNIDTANRANPVNGRIVMSNLCSEILQSQDLPVVNDEQLYEDFGSDISCNLGSINIPNIMKSGERFGKSVDSMVRALTTVTDKSEINVVPSVREGNAKYHTIGLGAMGLHHFLANNQMHYGSEEALDFVNTFFGLVNYLTLVSSNNIAVERDEVFHDFHLTSYADGSYFDSYISNPPLPKTDKVKELFKDIHLPSSADWEGLSYAVADGGLYHRYRMAVAPNGSISYVHETSPSLQPITRLVEERKEKKTGTKYFPAPDLNPDNIAYYTSAYDMDMRKVIDTYAEAQKHIDQGMSLTLFLRSEDIPEGLYPWKTQGGKQTTRDLTNLRTYAWHKGIKSIYYIRSYTESPQEAEANMCESCTV